MITGTRSSLPESGTIDDVVAALRQGDASRSGHLARRLLVDDPGNWIAWHAVSLASTAAFSEPPLAAFLRAVAVAPARSELWGTASAVLLRHRRHGAALRAARRSIALIPAGEAIINFGVALKEVRLSPEARRWLSRADSVSPGNPVVFNNLALLDLASGENERAAILLRAAVVVAPDYADARLNLAVVERRLGRPSAALHAVFGAVRTSPSDPGYLAELGTVLVTLGEAPRGLRWLRRALAADPADAASMASFLGALAYAPDVTEDERRRAYARAAVQAAAAVRSGAAMIPSRRSDDRRLTIGYVSGTFHHHPMAFQLVELLSHHDRGRVRVIAYADGDRTDAMTARLRASTDLWVDTAWLSDHAIVEAIRADHVDVLVFLAQHEQNARRSLPCHRAAPIQVSLHDIATSGLPAMDAWLTDPLLHPPDTTEWFSEALVRIPSLFLFSVFDREPSPMPRAADGPFTFASFNNPAKLSGPTLAAWAAVLRGAPGSALLLKYQNLLGDPAVAARVRQAFSESGVDPVRLHLMADVLPREQHLSLVGSVDVVLDPFPYNGNTATIEALWMGVPVVSLRGARFVGRMGAAILERVGLGDLAADSVDNYVRVALDLAADTERRRRLRATLRDSIRGSVLFDASGYARSVERALLDMAAGLGSGRTG